MYKKMFTILMLTAMFMAQAQDSRFNIDEFYPIENSHSYIGFSVKYMGYARVRGRFEKFKGTFRYDEKDISKTSVSLLIDAASIDTDNNRRDKDLKSGAWFDVEKFPDLVFVSKKVRPTASGFEITGDLSIKGITKTVIIKMNKASGVLKDTRGDNQVIFSGETTIDRTDFGVEGKRWSAIKEGIAGVAKEIKIEVSILGKQINARNAGNWVRNEKSPQGKIYKTISEHGIAQGLRVFEEMRGDSGIKLNFRALNLAGYMLLKEGKIKAALAVYKKNIEVFPGQSRLYDAYAGALAVSGNLAEAKAYYQKALEKDPGNNHASEILRHLK